MKRMGARTLSEDESRRVLEAYGIPLVESRTVHSDKDAVTAAGEIGFPVVLKGTGKELTHKTESGVVHLNLRDAAEVEEAYQEIESKAGARLAGVLVQRMIRSDREFVAGMKRDPQFGPCVMFGLGGIYTEALKDVSFRVAPLERIDAEEMLDDLKASKLLGPLRGRPDVDRNALCDLLIALGRVGLERNEIAEIDLNPVLLDGSRPLAADALVVLGTLG
jgi:succinyl-CoA synthetase beta subunit